MSATDNRPQNLSFLSQVGFKFEIVRAPNFNYFIQKIDFPGVSLPTVFQPTPFVKSPLPGEHLDYDKLRITFKLDEDLRGYFELYDWLTALGKPENFDESAAIYRRESYEKNSVFSQASLVILNGNMMPNVQINFHDVLPTSLSGFSLQTDATDINYVTASIELTYRMYRYEYIS